MQPSRDELLDVLKALLLDAETIAWDGFSIHGDDDAKWRQRLSEEQPAWTELINHGRRTLEASGVTVPTPIEIREERERKREAERQKESDERKRQLDAKRCKMCGSARGHKKNCPKRKKS